MQIGVILKCTIAKEIYKTHGLAEVLTLLHTIWMKKMLNIFTASIKQFATNIVPPLLLSFQKSCDQYFFNSHRNECRGIGGIFYDYLKTEGDITMEDRLAFSIDSGNAFTEAYVPIIEKHKKESFTEAEKEWQKSRRGRYVEFNLLHDRGTHFGIKTKGRTESILMSLPATVRWEYNHHPAKGSAEEQLIEVLKNPREWTK